MNEQKKCIDKNTNEIINKPIENNDEVAMSETQVSCPYQFCPDDEATKTAHLGWRVAYTLISWFVLGHGITLGNGFFVSLVLFVSTLFMDYLKFKPKAKWRKIIKKVSLIVTGAWIIIGVFGLINILYIKNVSNVWYLVVSEKNLACNGGIFCPLKIMWFFLSSCLVLTIIDWIGYESNAEYFLTRERKK